MREAVESKGQRRGTRSVRGSGADRGADSFDSVRLELAGFGEYGSFVVGRGAPRRLETAAAVVVVEAEPSGMKPPLSRRRSYLVTTTCELGIETRRQHPRKPPTQPTDRPTDRDRGTRAEHRESPEELRTDLLFVTRVCVNPSAVSSPSVRTSVYKRAATKATMYYHR